MSASVFQIFIFVAVLIKFSDSCSRQPERAKDVLEPELEEPESVKAVLEPELEDDECSDSGIRSDKTGDDELIDDFEVKCHKDSISSKLKTFPGVIIIGTKKGGTRGLIEFLNLHPSLVAAGPEVHFFDKRFRKGVAWYISRMPLVGPGQICMEKTPAYFHHPEAPKRIFKTNRDTKLLLIVRDPVERVISDYNQFRINHLTSGQNYPSLEEFLLLRDGQMDEDYPPVERSVYHRHFRRWIKYFSRNQIHVVDGDNFIREPWTELEKVETFLSIPHLISKDNFFFNETKGFYCAREIKTSSHWRCTKDKCLSPSKGRPRPPVETETLKKLRQYFAPKNKLFYEIVQRDFGWPVD